MQRQITVREQEKLYCNVYNKLTTNDLDRLLEWQEQSDIPVFQPIYKGLRLRHYVGVLQIGDISLEILPKVQTQTDHQQSRGLLLHMLQAVDTVPIYVFGDASVAMAEGRLLDVYVQTFLGLVEGLLRSGLQRAYRLEAGTLPYWKGRMDINRQLNRSLIHQERLQMTYQVYDYQSPAHRLIFGALRCLAQQQDGQQRWQSRLRQLLSHFPAQEEPLLLDPPPPTNNPYYPPCLRWAKWIYHRLQPNIRAGEHRALSLLTDMNRLFEAYAAKVLAAVARRLGLSLQRQPVYDFWETKQVRPDFVLQTSDGKPILVADAKWKRLRNDANPDDADLRQLFAYQQRLQLPHGLLLYPHLGNLPTSRTGNYAQSNERLHLLFLQLNLTADVTHCEQYLQTLDIIKITGQ